MLRSYFIIAFRNMMRNKLFSGINVFGLSLSVACCLLLTLYIQDEMSYDSHHNHLQELYRITAQFQSDKGLDKLGTSSPPIAMVMRDEIPEIEQATRTLNPPGVSQNLIKYEDKIFYETQGYIADSTLFEVLTYDLIEGNPATALVEANSVVINDLIAKKLFGNESALDKMIYISQGGPAANFKITGVMKDQTKSFFHANFFVSMTSSGWAEYLRSDEATGEWAGQNFVPSFVRLSPGQDVDAVIEKMNQVLMKHGADDMKALGFTKTLSLEPVRDIYLRSDIGHSPRITYLYVIASIAMFILLIACINFMNLATAKAAKRAAEIGMRKVMGAFRISLVRQILGEAMVIVMISMVFSLVFVQAALPLFNSITGKSISFGTQNIGYFILALSIITLFTGLLAGSYPAFYLSSFQPAQVLKGKSSLGNASGWLRRTLVVFQFMIAITLVCGMIIISRQLNYMQNKNLGFDSHAKIIFPLRTESAKKNYISFTSEMLRSGKVISAVGTENVPGSQIWSDFSLYTEGSTMDKSILHRVVYVDYGFNEMMGIKLVAGRSFSENRELESQRKIVVNQASAKKLGLTPEQAVGQKVSTEFQGEKFDFEIIGVMEDYHQISLREEIYPILFRIPAKTDRYDFIVASVLPDDFTKTLESIEKIWKNVIQDTPFEYSFLDDNIRQQYEEDKKVSTIITSFTLIAMLISCLGLYGLSTFMAERRLKEIGVRKVMGASVKQIVGMMSKEFAKLVIVAFVISVPLAWYTMNQWLEGFAYRISMDAMVFVYAGAGALFIALLTVSFESIKAAMGNPVESLRNE